jgi:DNA-binding GntR family transcriptional regulator
LAQIAAELGVSTMPVRIALMRLEAERLVTHMPRRGAVVAPLSVDDFEEIQALRAGIEGLAARWGAPRLTDSDIAQLRKALGRLRQAAAAGRLTEYVHLVEEIHDICYRASGKPRLMELIEEHRRPADRYVRLVIKASPKFHWSVEHVERFFAACAQRDGELAEGVLREGMRSSVDQVATHFGKSGVDFGEERAGLAGHSR